MNFQELRNLLIEEYNDSNNKCYNNIKKLSSSFSRRKKLMGYFVLVTPFVDELFKPSKKVPKPNLSVRIYCIFHDIDCGEKYPRCPICGKPRCFISINKGFGSTCGNPYCFQKLPEVNEKRQKTAKSRYGSLKAAYYDTSVETIQEKYGVDNVSKLDWVKASKIETSINNWGTEYPNQSVEGKKLYRDSLYNKYGVYNVSQLDWVKASKIETSIKNWGVDNPSQHIEVRGRILKANGKEYITKSGKVVLYDGFENIVLDYLYNNYPEDKIIPQPEVTIKYELYEKERVWFPDCLILDEPNELVEFKTVITDIDENEKQILASRLLGYDSYLIFQKNDELTRLDFVDDTWIITSLTSGEKELNRLYNWLTNNTDRKLILNND